MKLDEKFIERRDKMIESLREGSLPFVLAYAYDFDSEGLPVKAHLHGAGKSCTDIDILLTALGQAAYVKLYKANGKLTYFKKHRAVVVKEQEPPEPAPVCVLEECET